MKKRGGEGGLKPSFIGKSKKKDEKEKKRAWPGRVPRGKKEEKTVESKGPGSRKLSD